MITNPAICKHPLLHKVTNDIRYYCPDCGKFVYDYELKPVDFNEIKIVGEYKMKDEAL